MARSKSMGIASAGSLGRLLASHLASTGHAVTVFDPADDDAAAVPRCDGQGDAGVTAAGILFRWSWWP